MQQIYEVNVFRNSVSVDSFESLTHVKLKVCLVADWSSHRTCFPPLQHPCCPSTCGQLDEVEEDHRHLKASLRGTSHHGRSIRSRSEASAFTQLRVGTGDITRSSGAARPRTPHRSSYGNEPAGEEGGERRGEGRGWGQKKNKQTELLQQGEQRV